MKEIHENARKIMQGTCKVCRICDGRACAGEVPGMGGVGTGSSFIANIKALAARRFNMQLIHDVTNPDTRVRVLGQELAIPVLAAPIGGVDFNMGGRISEEEYILAVLEGCCETGVLGCTGDGAPDVVYRSGFAAIRACGGKGIPFIKPWADAELFPKMEAAAATGSSIMGIDIDAAGLITLNLMGRPVSPRPVEKIRKIIHRTAMKMILKGIMSVKDARRAVEAGADAIAVSNHGGRVLDHTPGTADVLPEIADAVGGDITIFADGGIRNGGDVLKMLALGAEAVMIGRPIAVAAMGGGSAGVVKFLEQIRADLVQTMILTGCRDIASVDRTILSSRLSVDQQPGARGV